MIEGLLFMLDILLMTLLCLGIHRAEKAPADEKRMGVFLYDDVQ
jgi:hypothetical protein